MHRIGPVFIENENNFVAKRIVYDFFYHREHPILRGQFNPPRRIGNSGLPAIGDRAEINWRVNLSPGIQMLGRGRNAICSLFLLGLRCL